MDSGNEADRSFVSLTINANKVTRIQRGGENFRSDRGGSQGALAIAGGDASH